MSTESDRVRKSLSGDPILRIPKAAEQIAQRIRGQIVRGEIEPGTMLKPEKDLLAEYGVSRPTLREAYRVLESEGLLVVTTGARGGPRVQVPDLGAASRQIGYYLQIRRTTLADLLEARAEFEPICARLLAGRRTEQALIDLDECLARLRTTVDAGFETDGEFVEWVELTREFHDLVTRHCGNNTLAAQAQAMSEMIRAHHRSNLRSVNYRPSSPTIGPEVIADYTTLLEKVRARDADGAEDVWRRHLQRSATLTFATQEPDTVVDFLG